MNFTTVIYQKMEGGGAVWRSGRSSVSPLSKSDKFFTNRFSGHMRIIVIIILAFALFYGVTVDIPEAVQADYAYWSKVLHG